MQRGSDEEAVGDEVADLGDELGAHLVRVELEPADVRAELVPQLRDLVADGLLV
jgi:hypothetical protein